MAIALPGTKLAGLRIGSIGRARSTAPRGAEIGALTGNENLLDRAFSPGARIVSYSGQSATPRGRSIEKILNDADILMPREWIPRDSPVIEIARQRGIPVLSEIELAYRICRAPILAVSGTCGKSITSALLVH